MVPSGKSSWKAGAIFPAYRYTPVPSSFWPAAGAQAW